jgi:hypothetical protein
MNTNLSKLMTTTFLAWTFIFQSVAFAMKPVEVSNASSMAKMKTDKMAKKMGNRYDNMSDKRKLRLLKRSERKLKRNLKKLNKISDVKFYSKTKSILKSIKTKAKKANAKKMDLSSEEKEVLGDIAELKKLQNSIEVNENAVIDRVKFSDELHNSLRVLQDEIYNLTKTTKRAPANIQASDALIGGILAALVVGAFFSTVALWILVGLVGFVIVAIGLGFLILRAAAGDIFGNIVGQV